MVYAIMADKVNRLETKGRDEMIVGHKVTLTDLDGTLIDSGYIWMDRQVKTLGELGIETEDPHSYQTRDDPVFDECEDCGLGRLHPVHSARAQDIISPRPSIGAAGFRRMRGNHD